MKSEKGELLIVIVTIFVIAIILGTFILFGYAIKQNINYGTKEGKVVDKQYHSAYTTYMYSGKVMIPQYHPESWQIKIQKEIGGETKSIWINIDNITYHEIKIGDYYSKEAKE